MSADQQLQIADFKLKICNRCSLKVRISIERMKPVCNSQSEIFNSSGFCAENPAQNSGDSSAVAPPVPIPNTEVKRCSPDGSTATGHARVGRRQSKMPGGLLHRAFCLYGDRLLEDRPAEGNGANWEAAT